MTIIERAYSEEDKKQMAALTHGAASDNLHIVDLPYRFCSWAYDNPENSRVWVDDAGTVVAWATMQTPFWSIDYACHQDHVNELRPKVLTWVDQRARQIVGTDYGRPMWFVNPFADQAGHIRDLEAAGFADQSDVGEYSWSKVFMQNVNLGDVATPIVPDGFTIRPLAGASEVQAYVDLHRAAFDSESMTTEWRARTLQHPDYVPEIDLVAVAPDGRLAAFCICWLRRAASGISGQVEPLGAHPDFHGLGLGRAILTMGLRQLHEHGAREAFVETDNYRDAAFALYESVGYRVQRNVLVYRKEYEEGV